MWVVCFPLPAALLKMGIATFVLFLTCLVGLSYAAPAPIPAVHQQREAREETVPENSEENDNTSGESTMGERPLIFQCVEVSSSSAAASICLQQ